MTLEIARTDLFQQEDDLKYIQSLTERIGDPRRETMELDVIESWNGVTHVYLALRSGEKVGFAILNQPNWWSMSDDVAMILPHIASPGDCFLSDMAVEPEHRGTGVGTRLVRAAEETAVEWSADRLIANVNEENVLAQRFLAKLGFLPEVKLGALYMIKKL